MPIELTDPRLIDAYKMLRTSGPRGRELADVLDGRETRVRFSSRIQGGFTLNFINTIFLSPPADPNSDWYFKYLVTLLGHEACHVEQRYWVDSVQQEMRAYASQVRVADELNFNPGPIKDHFADLDPDSPGHQRIAHQAMITLFAGQSAAIVYAALPLLQPVGLDAVGPAFHELAAVVRAAVQDRRA